MTALLGGRLTLLREPRFPRGALQPLADVVVLTTSHPLGHLLHLVALLQRVLVIGLTRG